MYKTSQGSIVLILIGVFWIIGIVAAVLYTMVAHITSIAELREIQTRYHYALEGGMLTALAHLKDQPAAYALVQSQALYEGPWPVDMRHPMLVLRLQLSQNTQEGDQKIYTLTGTLSEGGRVRLAIAWCLEYQEKTLQWRYLWGEQIYI